MTEANETLTLDRLEEQIGWYDKKAYSLSVFINI